MGNLYSVALCCNAVNVSESFSIAYTTVFLKCNANAIASPPTCAVPSIIIDGTAIVSVIILISSFDPNGLEHTFFVSFVVFKIMFLLLLIDGNRCSQLLLLISLVIKIYLNIISILINGISLLTHP